MIRRARFRGFGTFRARVFWSVIPIVLSLSVIYGLVDLRERQGLVEAEFMKRGEVMGANLADSSKLAVFAENGPLLESSIRGMLGDPDVAAVLEGKDGVFSAARPGTIVIDMSSISPVVTRQLYGRAQEAGVTLLDAPVSGGEVGAVNGTLSRSAPCRGTLRARDSALLPGTRRTRRRLMR